MKEAIDFAYEVVHVITLPVLVGMGAWTIRTWDRKEQRDEEIHKTTMLTLQAVSGVDAKVEKIQTNHLEHLQEGITRMADTSDKMVDSLHSIDTGIQVLVDRRS